jgi:hypothetical protein
METTLNRNFNPKNAIISINTKIKKNFRFLITTVKSGNFVNFFAQNIFFTKFHEGTLYFFFWQ